MNLLQPNTQKALDKAAVATENAVAAQLVAQNKTLDIFTKTVNDLEKCNTALKAQEESNAALMKRLHEANVSAGVQMRRNNTVIGRINAIFEEPEEVIEMQADDKEGASEE